MNFQARKLKFTHRILVRVCLLVPLENSSVPSYNPVASGKGQFWRVPVAFQEGRDGSPIPGRLLGVQDCLDRLCGGVWLAGRSLSGTSNTNSPTKRNEQHRHLHREPSSHSLPLTAQPDGFCSQSITPIGTIRIVLPSYSAIQPISAKCPLRSEMFSAMLLAISIVALGQFAVFYWRAVVAGIAAQPISEQVLAAAKVESDAIRGDDFR